MAGMKNQEDPMATLCSMVVITAYEDLLPNAVNYAKQPILDTMGIIIGGSEWKVPAVGDFLMDRGGKPRGSYLFMAVEARLGRKRGIWRILQS